MEWTVSFFSLIKHECTSHEFKTKFPYFVSFKMVIRVPRRRNYFFTTEYTLYYWSLPLASLFYGFYIPTFWDVELESWNQLSFRAGDYTALPWTCTPGSTPRERQTSKYKISRKPIQEKICLYVFTIPNALQRTRLESLSMKKINKFWI